MKEKDAHMVDEKPGGGSRNGTAWVDRLWMDRLEFVSSLLLAAAVVLTAYSAWQATRWGGVQSTDFAEAGSLRTEAATEITIGTAELAYDATTFSSFVFEFRDVDFDDPAVLAQVSSLADHLMRDEFRPFLEEWILAEPDDNPETPNTPFGLPNFANDNLERSLELQEEAELRFQEAQEANETADSYIFASIFFASVLFFAGISSKINRLQVRGGVLALASVGLILGVVRLATLPFE